MEESYKKVSFQEAKHIIDTEPNCVILDVRDEDEYITGHAENAVLFPVDTIDEDTAEEKIPTLDTPILVYCKSGRRSFMAASNSSGCGSTLGSMYGARRNGCACEMNPPASCTASQ